MSLSNVPLTEARTIPFVQQTISDAAGVTADFTCTHIVTRERDWIGDWHLFPQAEIVEARDTFIGPNDEMITYFDPAGLERKSLWSWYCKNPLAFNFDSLSSWVVIMIDEFFDYGVGGSFVGNASSLADNGWLCTNNGVPPGVPGPGGYGIQIKGTLGTLNIDTPSLAFDNVNPNRPLAYIAGYHFPMKTGTIGTKLAVASQIVDVGDSTCNPSRFLVGAFGRSYASQKMSIMVVLEGVPAENVLDNFVAICNNLTP